MYDRIVKYLPLLTVCVFIYGYAYQSTYYSCFNINILLYENTSEVLYTLLPFTLIVFAAGFGILQGATQRGSIRKEKENGKKKKITGLIWLYIIAALVFIAQLILQHKYGLYRDSPVVNLLWLLLVFGIVLYDTIKTYLNGTAQISTKTLFFIFILIGYFIIQYASGKGNVMKELGNEKTYTFYIKGNALTTNKNLSVVGETQGFIFLYNKQDSTTNILTRTNVDSLKIK